MSWFSGNTKRVSNEAEKLSAASNKTAAARRERISNFTPVLVQHLLSIMISFSTGELNPTKKVFNLRKMFSDEKTPDTQLIYQFTKNAKVPVPNFAEIKGMVEAVKVVLEDPVKYGFTVSINLNDHSIFEVDWTTPVVPPEPPKSEPPKSDSKPDKLDSKEQTEVAAETESKPEVKEPTTANQNQADQVEKKSDQIVVEPCLV